MSNETLVKEIDAALTAHALWKMKLTKAINVGECDAAPYTIACDDQCAFGKWLYGSSLSDHVKAGKPYQVTKRLHADFHKMAGGVASLAIARRKGEAFALMESDYATRSETLTRALKKWRGELTA